VPSKNVWHPIFLNQIFFVFLKKILIILAKLKNKKFSTYKGKVYDLTVSNSHSYNIDGISVHNSAAGCLLSWCLDITKIDPLRFGLYFERFLNPTRNVNVDIDIDYMTGTDEVTDDFLYQKYGKERVLNVGTFLTFSERGTLKDVARSLLGREESGNDSAVAKVTNEMPLNFDKEGTTLEEWFENYPNDPKCSEITREFLTNPKNKSVLDYTLKLQGQIRGIGQHAAGIVITPRKSWDCIPTNAIGKEGGSESAVVTAFQEADKSGKDLSTLGILKLDRLKLETLNIIKDAIEIVKEFKGKDITNEIDYIDLTDKNLFDEVRLGLNHGVFQFESPGMNALIKAIAVDSFEDLTACNALYRPGPMSIGAHTEYKVNKFNPNEIKYIHPSLSPILGETRGVMIYQEQLMFIASRIGGMSLGDGDNLRRGMDKAGNLIAKEASGTPLSADEKEGKDYQYFLKYWNMFLEGAIKNGLTPEELEDIKKYLIKYLGYSFNKCLTKNHMVKTELRGEVYLLDVIIGEKVLGYNLTTKKEEYNIVKDIHHNGIKKVYRVQLDSGKYIECTMDHKIMTMHGMRTLKEIVEQKSKIKTLQQFREIVSVREIGEVETYDLEIDSDDHNFYANGVCVSNSHSVSYTYLAMQTLYLKHYYPTEFYTSLLNHTKSNGKPEDLKKWITTAIIAAMSKGISVKPPSRKSDWNWKMTGDKEISMGFSSIKGFGDVAYEELMNVLKEKKSSLETISKYAFISLPLSKFGKAAFESCAKAGMFDDWGPSREELLDLFVKGKKAGKKIPLAQMSLFGASYEPELKHNEQKFEKTSEKQKDDEFIEVCNFDLKYIERIFRITSDISARANRSINAINDYYDEDYYWFILESKMIQKTKTGKDYLTLKVTDGIGTSYLRLFGKDMNEVKDILEVHGIYVGYFKKNDQGFINFSKKKIGGENKIYLVKVDNL
jgi:DNA polymerase III alpha subunit